MEGRNGRDLVGTMILGPQQSLFIRTLLHSICPSFAVGASGASQACTFRPMAPKQTLVQNNILAIHVKTPTLSLNAIPSNGAVPFFICGPSPTVEGNGTISGLTTNKTTVPMTPTADENAKPALLRSMRYQSTGFASASVRDTCSVDCQGSFRTAKAMPTKAPMPRMAWDHSVAASWSFRVGSERERLGRDTCEVPGDRRKLSTHGNVFPSKIPEHPHATKKYHLCWFMILTELNGCVFCSCVMIVPYATPKANRRTFRRKSGA